MDHAKDIVKEVSLSHLASDLYPGLAEAIGAVERGQASNKEFYLFSDMHKLGFEQIVDREPTLAGQVADAAAQREPAHAGGRDDPARRRQPVLVGRLVDLAPGAAAADAHRAGLRVHLDAVQRGKVDHDAAVACP